MMFTPGKTLITENAQETYLAGLSALAQGQTSFDFSQTKMVDSSAVAVLLEWKKAAKERQIALSFEQIPDDLQSLIALYGASELFNLHA